MVLYVYAITRKPAIPDCDAVDGTRHFGTVCGGDVCATFTHVDDGAFSQEVIDRRAGDLEWLGAIGYRHQAVIAALMDAAAVIPLRAFTMFSSESALREHLVAQSNLFSKILDRLDGKREYTLRIELDPQRWNDALVARVESLRALAAEIDAASSGKAFLLRKKLDEEKKRASREAEQQLVAEIEKEVAGKLTCDVVSESRVEREGAFPQINVLIDRDEESRLQELHGMLADRFADQGVTLAITGPWPPYTFANA